MKIVISMGGSILASPSPNVGIIKDFAKLLIDYHNRGHRLFVVVGGGQLARDYIRVAKELGADEQYCDEIGIRATRMNAMLLTAALGDRGLLNVASGPGEDFESKDDSGGGIGIFVMGGVKPGQTTDAVAAKLASKVKADLLINATNVDGVYDSDPNENPDAKKFDTLTYDGLLEIVGEKHRAGVNTVIDPIAARVIKENEIRTVILNGKRLENVKNAIDGGFHGGTVVTA